MEKAVWLRKITKACKDAGTYRAEFKPVIETLAQILETRDSAHEQYVAEGSHPTIIRVNQAGNENIFKNPILTTEMDLNAQALTYWRECGLTPSALRKMTDAVEAVAAKPVATKIDKRPADGLEMMLEAVDG